MVTPGVSFGTMICVILPLRSAGPSGSSVRHITMKKSARLPFEVNHLWPLITHSSPSRKPEAPEEQRPFDWPEPQWARRPQPEEPPHEPYSSDSYPREPYSHQPYSGEQYSREPHSRDPYPDDLYESRIPSRRSRDPLARLFPGLPRSVRVT